MRSFLAIAALAGLLATTSCKVNHIVSTEADLYRMNEAVTVPAPDTSILALIGPYKSKLDAEMNAVIGTFAHGLSKQQPESTMGNWFADLLHQQAEATLGHPVDFAIVNYGGMRIPSIPAGPVTKSKVFELMPFDNLAVVVHLDAESLRQLFAKMASRGGWPISGQVKFEISNEQAGKIRINAQTIAEDRIYTVAMSDYIANGGDGCSFLTDLKQENTGILLRDMILNHIREQTARDKMLGTRLDGRVISKDR